MTICSLVVLFIVFTQMRCFIFGYEWHLLCSSYSIVYQNSPPELFFFEFSLEMSFFYDNCSFIEWSGVNGTVHLRQVMWQNEGNKFKQGCIKFYAQMLCNSLLVPFFWKHLLNMQSFLNFDCLFNVLHSLMTWYVRR